MIVKLEILDVIIWLHVYFVFVPLQAVHPLTSTTHQ